MDPHGACCRTQSIHLFCVSAICIICIDMHAPDAISAAKLRSSKAHNSDQARWRSSAHCMAWFHCYHRIPWHHMTIKAHQTLDSLDCIIWVLAGLLLSHSVGSGVGVHFRKSICTCLLAKLEFVAIHLTNCPTPRPACMSQTQTASLECQEHLGNSHNKTLHRKEIDILATKGDPNKQGDLFSKLNLCHQEAQITAFCSTLASRMSTR